MEFLHRAGSMAGSIAAVLAVSACLLPVSAAAEDRSRAQRLRDRGHAWLAAGNPGSAAAYFRDAIRADPRDAESYAALGTIYLERGATRSALEVFRAGLGFRPGDVRLMRLVARAFEARGDPARALEVLDRLVVREPTDLPAHRMRARIARRYGAWSRALAATRAVLALSVEGASADADEELAEARRFARALAILVGDLDPVTGVRCDEEPRSIRRALAGCEP